MIKNIEAQIIVRQETGFGLILFEAVLKSILPYMARIVLVDNECDRAVCDMYHAVVPKDKLKVININGHRPYSQLRNIGLDNSSPDCKWVLFVDSDELYCDAIFEEAATKLKDDISFVYVPLNYLFITPCFLEAKWTQKYRVTKTTGFYQKVSGVRFKGDVHEDLPTQNDRSIVLSIPCIHWWTQTQWRDVLKVMWYHYLEYGCLINIKKQFQEYQASPLTYRFLRQQYIGRTVPYKGPWYSLTDIAAKYGQTREDWAIYLESMEDYSFWYWWQELKQTKGNWVDTLDIAFERYYKIRL